MVSRFRTKAEQKQILDDLAAGKVEIIVGTHRLLSKDVQFRDLGLLVVDEEQRFGVAHKERIKQLRKRVDVLTMTRDPDSAHAEHVARRHPRHVDHRNAAEGPPVDPDERRQVRSGRDHARRSGTELERGGQVYFVHNRVESIYSMANLIQRLVPEARIGVGHGQMSEDDARARDGGFRRAQVRRAAGHDDHRERPRHPEREHDDHQPRRSLRAVAALPAARARRPIDRRAYAYLLIPPEETLSPVAKKRLAAIREFSDLGSGFRVAALDLEIRGAGNLLGGEQSGHIEAVGFDMYMKLLEETIKELKGEEIEDEVRATVNLRRRPADRRRLHPRHEPAPDGLPPHGGRADRGRAGTRCSTRSATATARRRTRSLNLAEYALIRLLADRVGARIASTARARRSS